MAHALPIHIIREIERRWQRRMDASPQRRLGKAAARGAPLCPQCYAPALIGSPSPSDSAPVRELVCDLCGHIWRNES